MKIPYRRLEEIPREELQKLFARSEADISAVTENVSKIIRDVKNRGDAALREFTLKFDKADISALPIRVREREFDEAERELSDGIKEAILFAVENVRRFHAPQKPSGLPLHEIRPGVFAGERATPIESVGLYVPRGRGSFPSMLYMLAVPARIAGVERVCIVTPPSERGTVDAACLFAARACGVTEVYRVGGAQAVAALAYGTESIRPVRKILGPGSMYVTAAKRLLHGVVDVGLPAGPSESIVLADDTAAPRNVTLDLLVEAEHGSDSSAILVTPSEPLAREVAALLGEEIERLPEPRKSFVRDVFSGYGGIIVTGTIDEAAKFVNEFAPEHLQIQTEEPFELLSRITNAGEILLGEHVPFSLANYAVGANAVLPTGGNARTWSAVSVRDFMKYSSVVYLTKTGYRELADHVVTLAAYEGFVTHANAITKRSGAGSDRQDPAIPPTAGAGERTAAS